MRPAWQRNLRYVQTAFDWLLRGSALGLLILLLVRALRVVTMASDAWYYHLPFAARLLHIVGPDRFLFYPGNEQHFRGFPLVGEFIQGVLWRAFGRPEAANLFAWGSIPLFCWFLKRRFAVPPHLSVLALLAIPMVHLQATSALIDLPSGCAGAALALLTIRAVLAREALPLWSLAGFLLLAAFAINTKAFLHPLTLICVAVVGFRAIVLSRALPEKERRRYRIVLALGALLLPVVFATPLRNLIRFGNPYYPYQIKVFGHPLPGAEEDFSPGPVFLEHAPRPQRFLISIFELTNLPLSDPEHWTYSQTTTDPRHPGFLMGGFFGLYVACQLGILGYRLLREGSRELRVAATGFALVTALTSFLPQSHELRYYSYWMILLVSINLWFGCKVGPSLFGPRVLALVASLALLVVVKVTSAAYVLPVGPSFATLLRQRTNERLLLRVPDGSAVCVVRYPFNLLWADKFHPPHHYLVQEAMEPADCQGIRQLDTPPTGHRPRRRLRPPRH